MRMMLVGLAALAILTTNVPTAMADNAPWCSTGFGGSEQATHCDFHSYAQCWETAKGGYGGDCVRNPDYAGARRDRGSQRHRGDQGR